VIDPPDKDGDTKPYLYYRGNRAVRLWHKPITELGVKPGTCPLSPKLLDMLSKSEMFGRRRE